MLNNRLLSDTRTSVAAADQAHTGDHLIDPAWVDLAGLCADVAGEIARGLFRTPLKQSTKPDRTPVTEADQAIERAVRALITEQCPGHGVLGEEYGTRDRDAEYLWVIDPIDGTCGFLCGKPLFGFLLALMHCGKPVLGLIDQPITGDRWIGVHRQPTRHNGKICQTSPVTALTAARLSTTAPGAFSPEELDRFDRLVPHAYITSYGGDCYQYGLVASGHLDLVVEASLAVHDWAALVPVCTGAGATVTDWTGAPMRLGTDGSIIVASTSTLADQARALLSAPQAGR